MATVFDTQYKRKFQFKRNSNPSRGTNRSPYMETALDHNADALSDKECLNITINKDHIGGTRLSSPPENRDSSNENAAATAAEYIIPDP